MQRVLPFGMIRPRSATTCRAPIRSPARPSLLGNEPKLYAVRKPYCGVCPGLSPFERGTTNRSK